MTTTFSTGDGILRYVRVFVEMLVFLLLKKLQQITCIHSFKVKKTWCEYYATGVYHKVVFFSFLQPVIPALRANKLVGWD
jgi:hypothetical protein